MCGLAGIVRADPRAPVDEDSLVRMAGALRHRGPDGWGLALDPGAGLVATRLAIVDLPGGWQPMAGASGSLLAFNGEVFNHVELRAELAAAGVRARTTSDTEVLLHLLERHGFDVLGRLNGQWAIAYWEPGPRRLTLARDRFGVRPVHYHLAADGSLTFGSEARALFASGEVRAVPDHEGLDDALTLWAPQPPRTCFAGVAQVAPGSLVVWERGRIVRAERWWAPEGDPAAPEADLGALLADSVRLRLRADVPVGTYLSGGLDSSLTTALAQQTSDHPLQTFSIAFADARYDERSHQELVARELGTEHHVLEVGPREIADGFRDAVEHCEAPLIRTAPVPLMLLARTARAAGITVVATGEGADELFWGYDLFKEVALRTLQERDPQRAGELVDGLYAHLGGAGRRGAAWRRSLLAGGASGDPLGSHLGRIRATGAVRALLRPELQPPPEAVLDRLWAALPADFAERSPLERAEALEIDTLLGAHLLAAQGDRVAMASGVEGRYPFLDHRVAALARGLAPERKLAADLRDKVALRDLAARLLPAAVASRPKQPYRAPEVEPFFGAAAPEWVGEMLTPAAFEEAGLFHPDRTRPLLERARAGRARSPRDAMAVLAVLSTQVWHARLCRPRRHHGELTPPRVRIDRTTSTTEVAR